MVAARAVIITPAPCTLSTYTMTNVNYRFQKIYFVRRVTGSFVWQYSFSHYYGTNTENSEWLVCTYGYLDTVTYFYDSLVIMLRRSIKRRLIFVSPSSESLAPSSDYFVSPRKTIQYAVTLLLHSRHFVRHLGICNPICVKLIQLMSGVITNNSVINEVSALINGWVTSNYSVSRPPFCPPSWSLLSHLCQTSTTHVRCHYAQFSEKRSKFLIYINKWLSYSQL